MQPKFVFVGHDTREEDAFDVCKHSILKHSSVPVHVVPLVDEYLRGLGTYRRGVFIDDNGQRFDDQDGKPFSTDFSFNRFLTKDLARSFGIEDWVIFCDSDFLFRSDIAELFEKANDHYAVMVVQQSHVPHEVRKMDNQIQSIYKRKNWSSLVMWNVMHPANDKLTVQAVNSRSGSYLHGFEWLDDSLIGSISLEWNYLIGFNTPAQCVNPKAVHFTLGIPRMNGYQNVEYAREWFTALDEVNALANEGV